MRALGHLLAVAPVRGGRRSDEETLIEAESHVPDDAFRARALNRAVQVGLFLQDFCAGHRLPAGQLIRCPAK